MSETFSEHPLLIATSLIILGVIVGIGLGQGLEENGLKIITVYGSLAAGIGTLGAMFFVGYQSLKINQNIKLQRDSFELEKRPYLYGTLEPVLSPFIPETGAPSHGGGVLSYSNEGSVPAGDIETAFWQQKETELLQKSRHR